MPKSLANGISRPRIAAQPICARLWSSGHPHFAKIQHYPSGAAGSIFVIAGRKLLRSMTACARSLHAKTFSAFRRRPANLKRSPNLHRNSPRTAARHHRLFEKTFPQRSRRPMTPRKAAFAESNPPPSKRYVNTKRGPVELLPRSSGDFHIGAATFSKNFCTTTWSPRRSIACWKSE